jgi:hypothetical protein
MIDVDDTICFDMEICYGIDNELLQGLNIGRLDRITLSCCVKQAAGTFSAGQRLECSVHVVKMLSRPFMAVFGPPVLVLDPFVA